MDLLYKFNGAGEVCCSSKRVLLLKAFSQIQGKDFHVVYAPVLKYATVWLLFTLSVTFNWKQNYIGVKNHFFNAPLNEKIYIQQPERFPNMQKENHVYHLKKAFYGLRQALRN